MNPLMRLGFRQILQTKKFWIAIAVSLLPMLAGIIVLISDIVEFRQDGYQSFADMLEPISFLVLTGSVPLTALLLAGGMMADDIEDRTLTYLLVRPIKRAELYFGKLVPVVAVTAGLAAVQTLLFGLTRIISWAMVGREVENLAGYRTGPWAFFGEMCGYRECGETAVATGGLVAQGLLVGVLAAMLLGAGLATLFSLVSLLTSRFHFLVNLILFLAWEAPFGHSSGRGLGFFTFSYHANSILARWGGDDVWIVDAPVVPWFGMVWIIAWTAVLAYLGMRLASTKDFPVTSATT